MSNVSVSIRCAKASSHIDMRPRAASSLAPSSFASRYYRVSRAFRKISSATRLSVCPHQLPSRLSSCLQYSS
eukprot:scaffold14886_cov44-Attheya_sp.AAC.4